MTQPVMYSVIANEKPTNVWCTSGVTSSTGALTITIPAGTFTTVYGAHPTAVRDTADPTRACFALVRSYSNTSIVIQVFESKTTGVLLGGTAEGLEPTNLATTVTVTVFGI